MDALRMKRKEQLLPAVSPFMWRWFTRYARRFVRRHFHAVRLLRAPGALPGSLPPDEPLILCCNHPSWWDPMIGIFLAAHLWPRRAHYWPIDAAMLQRYRFFARLGFFGVEKGSPRGAAAFLRTATAVLSRGDGTCLWVTAGGEFEDVRARPVGVRPGISHLARRLERGTVLPLAVEYPFWTEKAPEALLAFGRPISVLERPDTDAVRNALTGAMDALAAAAVARDPAAFSTLLSGAAGTSCVYDAWRRTRAALAGRRFSAAHVPETEARTA
jgi:1-acyl-sn-glycerol-3-phosphate acyltransferase